MPNYDYQCEACGHELEAFHAMSADPLVECPSCNKASLIKLISCGAAIIVKGTENPCRGNRGGTTQKEQRTKIDPLGVGKNKGEQPFWRDDVVNKDVLKDPEKYIQTGEID